MEANDDSDDDAAVVVVAVVAALAALFMAREDSGCPERDSNNINVLQMLLLTKRPKLEVLVDRSWCVSSRQGKQAAPLWKV